jgi:hypothetical protein
MKKIITCGWYNDFVLQDLKLDDMVQMRKAHPCGSVLWKVVRLGADIGLVCQTCGRKVLLPRRDLAKRMKKLIPGEANAATQE